MEIESSFINRSNQRVETLYRDIDTYAGADAANATGVHGYCFCDGKLVVVYADSKGYWGPPGGGIEPGETIEEATVREILEETNMRVVSIRPIGVLNIFEPARTIQHVRSFCIVEPIGPFSTDPDGDVTEIRLIDPADVKEYFDWGEPGERQLERALELYRAYVKE
jgi:8-oxo-dGTP pyrophosphatase MutT (NUDIX family)